MTQQVIGEGVIKVVGDASGVAGAMQAVREDAKRTGDTVGKAMSEGNKTAARGIDALIAKYQQSAAAVGKSAREVKLLELAQRGATQAQLQAADAALRTLEVAKAQQVAQRQAAQAAQANAAALAAQAEAGKTAGAAMISARLYATLAVAGFTQLARAVLGALDGLNDVADTTGASIENISALEDVAARTGTKFESVTTALIKFNSALNSAKPDSPIVQALAAIGLQAEDLRRLDPAEGLLRVAKALATFTDDGQKARIVQELFGKSVREIAPFLKDLADAGRLNATVTTAQAKEAERFNQELARLGKNAQDVARSVGGGLVESMNSFIDRIRTAKREQTGLFASMEVLAKRERERRDAMFTGTFGFPEGNAGRGKVNPDFVRPSVGDFQTPKEKPPKDTPRGAREAQFKLADDAAAKYIERLNDQIARTENLTQVEQTLFELRKLGSVSFDQAARAISLAQEIDRTKSINDAMVLRRQLILEEGDAVEATNAAYQARLRSMLDNTPSAVLQQTRDDLKLLTAEFEAGRISEEQYLEAVSERAGITNATLEKTKTLAEDLGLTFTSSFEDAIVEGKRLSDVLKGLERDILRIVTRKVVTEPLGNALTGAFTSSGGSGIGGFFSGILSAIGLGAPKAAGGPVMPNSIQRVNERGPELLDVGDRQYLMMGSQGGKVTANDKIGSKTVNLHITIAPPAGMSRQSSNQFAADVARELRVADLRNN